jgi:hypothetical protein
MEQIISYGNSICVSTSRPTILLALLMNLKRRPML